MFFFFLYIVYHTSMYVSCMQEEIIIFVPLNKIFILRKMCMANCAARNSFFADSNITGYIHTFTTSSIFFFHSRFYNISRVMLTQISVRSQKFASTIKLTFRRHIQ